MNITLKEVFEKHRSVIVATQLFGQNLSYAAEYAAMLKELGVVICREQNVSEEQGFDLPLTTVLREESLSLYEKLNAWIAQQPPLQ
jgi:hypothetical protein